MKSYETKKILKLIIDNMYDAIFIHKPDGTIIDVNEKMLKIYNMDTKEKAKKYSLWDDYLCPGNLPDRLSAFLERTMTGKSQLFEWKARRPTDGSLFDVEVFLKRLGRENLILATVRDVSVRKQLLRNLFAYSPIGMYVVENGKFKLINSQFEKYTGYTQDELMGTDSLSLVVPQQREMVRKNAILMLKGERSSPYEFRIINKNGELRWITETVTTIIHEGERATLGNFMDITDLKETEEKLKYLSFHDTLTGLYNRTYFEEEIKRLSTARQLPLSIIVGDVNGLKFVNDAFGHHEGDRLLKRAADVIKESCRTEDIICRWGGDEFSILLPRTGKKDAEEICVRIKDACSKAKEKPTPLSISLGTATKEEMNQNVWDILKEAEDRMYHHKFLERKSIRSSLIKFLQKSLAEKAGETEKHISRLCDYSLEIGKRINLSIDELNKLILLSSLHDIGKIAIPENILNKPGNLTTEDWEIIKKHSEIGYRIVQSIPELKHISAEILAHHERWDGYGYPQRLKGKEIPILARILAIVNAYDFMVNGRVNRNKISKTQAIEELKRSAGERYDPELVDFFINIISLQD
jgi:diguanylate cyclase (GGDEF)-like protein/PAS domain S-box-containing protein